jgi:N-glycosylase/DNA lyase
MTFGASVYACHRIDSTIRNLCLLIESEVKKRAKRNRCEYELRRELVGCILGSQVRFDMAVAATENLERANLLSDIRWCMCRDIDFESDVLAVLEGRAPGLCHLGSYRFPRVRARQLARVRDELSRMSLTRRLAEGFAPAALRKKLIEEIPGLGPKQASMFLRNIGRSYDLAILDTHVLRFIDLQGWFSLKKARINTVSGYEQAERVMTEYANTVGYPVGYLDWAIWATMKAARELRL